MTLLIRNLFRALEEHLQNLGVLNRPSLQGTTATTRTSAQLMDTIPESYWEEPSVVVAAISSLACASANKALGWLVVRASRWLSLGSPHSCRLPKQTPVSCPSVSCCVSPPMYRHGHEATRGFGLAGTNIDTQGALLFVFVVAASVSPVAPCSPFIC